MWFTCGRNGDEVARVGGKERSPRGGAQQRLVAVRSACFCVARVARTPRQRATYFRFSRQLMFLPRKMRSERRAPTALQVTASPAVTKGVSSSSHRAGLGGTGARRCCRVWLA